MTTIKHNLLKLSQRAREKLLTERQRYDLIVNYVFINAYLPQKKRAINNISIDLCEYNNTWSFC
jgi:hypothetical protein